MKGVEGGVMEGWRKMKSEEGKQEGLWEGRVWVGMERREDWRVGKERSVREEERNKSVWEREREK